jgi:hypothetical protein
MKPIIFSTPMVKAILDGRKTQTRRVIKVDDAPENWKISIAGTSIVRAEPYDVKLPRYAIGNILWVREKWRTVDYEYCDGKWSASIEYADGIRGPRVFYYDNSDVGIPVDSIYSQTGWHSPIFMPRDAARIFLRVKNVRVERVQDITEEDAKAEGCIDGKSKDVLKFDLTARDVFAKLWNSINAKRGYRWETNPWVWVYEFEKINKE